VKLTPARVRFVLEAAFLVIVAAICWAAHLSWKGIVPAMAVAWALVTLVERSAGTPHRETAAGPAPIEEKETETPPPPSHVTVLEPEAKAQAEQPPTPVPQPGPVPDPAPEPVPPVPEPEPPRPEPTPVPDPNPQLQAVPEPEFEPEPEPEAETNVTRLPVREGGPREWNVWELERIARELEGRDGDRDQELAFLLLELRQFANADGLLPPSFDPVVREAFGQQLYAGI